MKATIEADRVFTLTIGERTVRGLRETSRWEGLQKLVDDKGRVLIVGGHNSSPMDEVLSNVFGTRTPAETVVFIASPELAAELQHPDDAAVNQFADAMKAKLAVKRREGRSGWDDPQECSTKGLAEMLRAHVAKGDPVDVANFAMMLHHRGGRTNEGL